MGRAELQGPETPRKEQPSTSGTEPASQRGAFYSGPSWVPGRWPMEKWGNSIPARGTIVSGM